MGMAQQNQANRRGAGKWQVSIVTASVGDAHYAI
jgi:hypothetical protein